MKKRILYSILNEWRDEDMDDFPIDLDDVDFEATSSGIDNEPDLGDDDFELSTIHSQYEYFPETKSELWDIVKMEIEKQGGVHVNLNMIDTSKITDMSDLFDYCISLETLDVSKWNVSSVENMNSMFNLCKSLKTIDVSRWNVSSVENMEKMFNLCKSLKTIDVSRWNVSSVKNMKKMFYACMKLETLDVSKWKVSSVENMQYMFGGCVAFKTIDVSNWDVSRVENMGSMFLGCNSLRTNTTMWKINANKTTNMYAYAPNIDHN